MTPQSIAIPAGTGPAPVGSGDVPVVLAGVHGHGHWHLNNLARLAAVGSPLRLAGVCDPLPPTGELGARLGALPHGADLGAVIEQVGARITIVCTPIHTHAELAATAARHGSHVLLEKPPTATLESYADLRDELIQLGIACQVGFQSLGSPAIGHVQRLIADGAVGTVRGIGATCAWSRDESYWARAPWAGQRTLGGVPVVDGVLTNPFAHAVATALRLDGSPGESAPSDLEIELYHANEIEADDTSCVRLRTAKGTPVLVAATLCAASSLDPFVTVHGDQGAITLFYKRGEVRLRRTADGAGDRTWVLSPEDLLEDLLAHLLDPSHPLLVPLAATAAFMHVVEAIRTAPDPVPIPSSWLRQELTDRGHVRRVIPGVEAAVQAAASGLALFSELDLDWVPHARSGTDPGAVVPRVSTVPPRLPVLARLRVSESIVAEYVLGDDLDPMLSPRPFLHPVRTVSGAVVTDALPVDHRWHLGLGVAIQDVGGVNLWGGRTYVRDTGYVWREDHGRVRHLGFRGRSPSAFAAELAWLGPDGESLLDEVREVAAEPLPTSVLPGAWQLRLRFTLRNSSGAALALGSPGSNGREGGGYGGLFWRLPPFQLVEVSAPDAVGEAVVHGRPAPWLALNGRLEASRTDVTLVFRGADARTREDPWFVRLEGYPGVGSSLAAERPLVLAPRQSVTRRFDVLIADGMPEPTRLAAFLGRH